MTKKTERLLAFIFGVVFIVTILILAVRFPEPSLFQFRVFQTVLALAAAGVGAVLPGLINVDISSQSQFVQVSIRAAGALALFVVVYFFSPAGIVVEEPEIPPVLIQPEQPGEYLVVVAFYSVGTINASDKIVTQLKEMISQAGLNGRVRVEPYPVVEDRLVNEEQVRTLLSRHRKPIASAAIWGAVYGLDLVFHFTALKQNESPVEKRFEAKLDSLPQASRFSVYLDPSAQPVAVGALSTEEFNDLVARLLQGTAVFSSAFALGRFYYSEAKYKEVVGIVDSSRHVIENLFPEGVDITGEEVAYLLKGDAQYSMGDWHKAAASYEMALEFNPQYAEAYYNLGLAHRAMGDLDAAIVDYTTAIRLSEDIADKAFMNLGVAHFCRGELDIAINDYNEAIRLYKDDADKAHVHYNLGIVHSAQGSLDAADDEYNKAIGLFGDNADKARAYTYLGIIHNAQGNVEIAIDDFEQAIKLDPNNIDAFNNLCWYGSLAGYADDVLDECEQAVQLAPEGEKPPYRDSRGIARVLAGNYAGGLDDFKSFVAWAKERGGYDDYVTLRAEWIRKLESGQNPFDQAAREALMDDSLRDSLENLQQHWCLQTS